MNPELVLRIKSGLVLAVLVLAATWAGGIWFRLLAVAIAVLIFYEFSTIARNQERDPVGNGIGWLCVAVSGLLILYDRSSLALVVIVAGAIAAAAPALFRRKPAWAATALAYAGLSGLALSEIRGEGLLGLFAMLFVFAIVWATDILAYFCGRAIGGAKLAPSISPGKTWSGAIFGAAAGVAAGVAVALGIRPGGDIAIPLIALVLSIASQCGDLFESWIKRRFSVKDSSRLIPGHGGVMDRVDGLVFAAFAAFLIAGLMPNSSMLAGGDELAARLLGQ
ncbi:phosphatidate cytidylyltransferase [Hoeflea marina]|uniref:Phosphatidate cytidylyltransferase n=1 Tax=Hoeflea marina TaxID=274592 RepID=A0A317PR69_9HYPH|nr:phosphatidate cytidylyltransferase [Hoeflea marina]PWW03679.1 phosphatidate cytidylyltransferase [Hoeflea marina]